MSNRNSQNNQNDREKKLNILRLRDFDKKNSKIVNYLKKSFGNMNKDQLLSLAKITSNCLGLYLDREAQRRKNVLWKWFDENQREILNMYEENLLIVDSSQNETNFSTNF